MKYGAWHKLTQKKWKWKVVLEVYDKLIIIGEDWKYYKCEFDKEKGGNGKINSEINIWEKLEEERNE